MWTRKSYIKLISIGTLLLTAAGVLSATTGCSRRGGQDESQKQYITVKGSDTMVHLASSWAETFMKDNPGFEISVTGGGSGTGMAALINDTTDICASSREITEKERKLAEQKGISPEEIVVARDGIAVVVNRKNPVNELTLEQLAQIFTGRVTRWSAVGGTDEEIVVLSRESSSGTYVFFQERVLNKQDYVATAKLMPATSSIIRSVQDSSGAVGYVGLGYALAAKNQLKVLAVKADADSEAVIPSEETVGSGRYIIARPLYLYIKEKPTGTVKKFIDFCLSAEGQDVVKETGYVTVP